jgi:hypothetical protein
MPGLAPTSTIHPLCYEHHSEMTLHKLALSQDGMTYACPEPDCFVHYSKLDGYFLNTQDRFQIDRCPTPPHQYCPSDGYPMYLLEVQPKHPSFRLWRCPKCNMSRSGGQL